ncbi:MAG: methionyl-tRNA formyltransferase [Chloroflexota bacterium]
MATSVFAMPLGEALIRQHQIVAVYTRPDRHTGRGRGMGMSPVKNWALARGLAVYQPDTLKPAGVVAELRSLAPELIVVAAFGLLLPKAVLSLPRWGCLNLHPSLLPRWRGPSPVAAALLAGDEVSGVSLMLLDEGMDTGPILAQANSPISEEDTTASLTARLAELAAKLALEALPRWVSEEIIPQPQDPDQATYSRLLKKEDGELDWHLSARELGRRVRAFTPWPGAYTAWQGKRLRILQAVPLPGEAGEPGWVSEYPGGVGVGTGEGLLGLKVLQVEGRRPLPLEEFLRGQRGFIGSCLGEGTNP